MATPQPEPFDPIWACTEAPALCEGDPCRLRCHERYLRDERQTNDVLADAEQAAAWRCYYDANPGAEAASKAACDPKTYEEKA